MRPSARNWLGVLAFAAVAAGISKPAFAETITIYAAGSLTKVVEALAREVDLGADIDIKPTFGPAGRLRARIEAGETPDLFLSADMAAPRKLDAEGRTIMAPVAFARNRMCLVARRSLGVTPANLIDKMLAKTTRLKTSTPGEDPGGDYAMAIFDRIEAQRPGSGAILRSKAQAMADATKVVKQVAYHSVAASLFLSDQIDLMITYCSGAPSLQEEAPELTVIAFPPAFEPGPVNGMAILSAKPGALRLALYLMSEKGQAIVRGAELLPVLDEVR